MKRKSIALLFVLIVLLAGCESGSEKKKSEQTSDDSQKLTVEFWGTNLSVTNGFKTVAGEVAAGGHAMANIHTLRLYDKNGEVDADKGLLNESTVGGGAVILTDYWSEPDNDSDDQESGVYAHYESASYVFYGTHDYAENVADGATEGLVINGKKEKEITEQLSEPDGAKSFFDVSGLMSLKSNTYVELYIDGKKIEHDDSIYQADLDVNSANESLKKYKDLKLAHISFVPQIVAMFKNEISEANWNYYGTSKAFVDTFFIMDKLTEAVENNKKSICTIYYAVQDGKIDTITINMLVRKEQ